VTGVSVSPTEPDAEQGEDITFTANVSVTGGADTGFNWSVTGNTSTGTSITKQPDGTGKLTVAADEAVTTTTPITVKATSTFDGNKFGTAAVTVFAVGTKPTYISVDVSPATPTVQRGGTEPFTATVNGTNSPAQTVTWSVEGALAGTTISNDGVLTVAANEPASTLTVRATSTKAAVSGTATVTIPPTYTGVIVSPATVSVAKGSNKTFSATVQGIGNLSQAVTWSSVGAEVVGTTINTGTGFLTVAANETATTITVTATANGDLTGQTWGTATVTVIEPPDATLTITGLPSAANGKGYQAVLYAVSGFDPDQIGGDMQSLAMNEWEATVGSTSTLNAALYRDEAAGPINPNGTYIAVFAYGEYWSLPDTSEGFNADYVDIRR
jgi:hypothetical protein